MTTFSCQAHRNRLKKFVFCHNLFDAGLKLILWTGQFTLSYLPLRIISATPNTIRMEPINSNVFILLEPISICRTIPIRMARPMETVFNEE
jgi:hypothetical protein